MEIQTITPNEIKQASVDYAKTHYHETESQRVCCEADFRAGVAWTLEIIKQKTNKNDSTNNP